MNNLCLSILVAIYRTNSPEESASRLDKILSADDGVVARFLVDGEYHKFGRVFDIIFDYYRNTGLLIPEEDLYVRDIGLDSDDLVLLETSPPVSDEIFDRCLLEISAAFLKEEALARLNEFVDVFSNIDISSSSYKQSVSRLFSEIETIASKFASKMPRDEEVISLIDSLDALMDNLKVNPLISEDGSDEGCEISFGFSGIDDAVGKLLPGDLGVIVGETGVGKSFLVTEIARRNFLEGNDIVFVTTEMSNRHVTTRLLGLQAGINPRWIKEKELSSFAIERLDGIADGLKNVPANFVILEGKSSVSIASIISAIDAFKPALVIVDGVYMVKPHKVSSGMQLWEKVLTVMQTLKQLAMDAGVVILCTTQYSKKGRKYGAEGVGYSMEIPRIASVLLSFEANDPSDPQSASDLDVPAELFRRLKVLKGRDGGEGTEIEMLYNPARGEIREARPNRSSESFDPEDALRHLL